MLTEHTKYYNEEGIQIPSVTTILKVLNKPALVGWANKQGLKGISLLQATAYSIDVGNLLHHRINCYANNQEPTFNDFCGKRAIAKSAKLFDNFLEYLVSRDGNIIASEVKLVSTTGRFGGTLDLVVEVGEEDPQCETVRCQEVWDIKTSTDIWPEHLIQVCAYTILWHEHMRLLARPRVVLIPKSGKLYAPDMEENVESICNRIWDLAVPLWYVRKQLDDLL